MYAVDTNEAALSVPDDYATLNDFFTRELKEGTRKFDSDASAIISPVDGAVSAAGKISSTAIFQAKNLQYSLADLLATDTHEAEQFKNGSFATFYLAPHNYHRVHFPISGKLVAARYVPGDLFSVNESTVSFLPMLFVRNERLICHCLTDAGPLVLILVGALNVGSIYTRWTGEIRPRTKGVVEQFNCDELDLPGNFVKGELLGWFNMGSTVIILLPPATCEIHPETVPGLQLRMGQSIGSVN